MGQTEEWECENKLQGISFPVKKSMKESMKEMGGGGCVQMVPVFVCADLVSFAPSRFVHAPNGLNCYFKKKKTRKYEMNMKPADKNKYINTIYN